LAAIEALVPGLKNRVHILSFHGPADFKNRSTIAGLKTQIRDILKF
jgi:hypothetical protein